MSAPEASGSPVSVFRGWQGLNHPKAISKASRGLKRNLPPMHQSAISLGYDVCMETNTTSRKHNTLLPRTIIFVQTKAGKEYAAKDYAPQRWVKSISKSGALSYTTDPRMARRFKTEASAVAVCKKYAASLVIELHVDTLRWTDPADDCGYTYFGYFDGKTNTNFDLFTNQPVQPPAEYTRMMEILKGGN